MENQNEQQPLSNPRLYPLPPLDGIEGLIEEAAKRGVTRSFTAWSGVISNKLASWSEDNFPAIFVTISDQTWNSQIQTDEDPLNDRVFQRQVIGCQLVTGQKIDKEEEQDRVVKTVGGRSLVIKVRSGEKITVNDVPVTEIISVGDNQVWVLSKLLFIRPEDIELAIGRIRGDVR